jgi:hypothetical protein
VITIETSHGPFKLDADRLAPKLWIGSAPQWAEGSDLLHQLGFQTLVLCALEYQPPAHRFPYLRVIHAPFDDVPELDTPATAVVQRTARQVMGEVTRGRRTLVTCFAGRTRSGLVCARVLMKMSGAPAHLVVDHVQRLRANALTNTGFVDELHGYTAPSSKVA